MKKYFFCLLLLSIALNSFAQSKPDSTNSKVKGIIKFYPLQLLSGEFRFGYEKTTKRHYNYDFSVSYIYGAFYIEEFNGTNSFSLNSFQSYAASGFSIKAGIKYFTMKSNTGFFLNPLFLTKTYFNKHTEYGFHNSSQKFYGIGLHLLCGYKTNVSKKISLTLYSGIGVKKIFNIISSPNGNADFKVVTVLPQMGIEINYNL
ncbi:MAG: hypothetical protein RL708_560 [Bacteroidota bacterium]|jgi:hypothetical protein